MFILKHLLVRRPEFQLLTKIQKNFNIKGFNDALIKVKIIPFPTNSLKNFLTAPQLFFWKRPRNGQSDQESIHLPTFKTKNYYIQTFSDNLSISDNSNEWKPKLTNHGNGGIVCNPVNQAEGTPTGVQALE